ncbi:hypothetical protein [Paenisporosarcina sp. OV554]|uniref:hypothetical protein n=1 Tax=Paenisporosarcina sp. OV554 TaxID=2135694 RepID=UPI000D36DB73|nr:hypothetical protein [Paenisporosarcina sp. OV554]PUB09606.1 hypothetical protein C8K15_1279 [Paenisporosarcina sp. OV554]
MKFKEFLTFFLALIILAIYGALGGVLLFALQFSLWFYVLAVPAYLLMGYIFFLLKLSVHKDIYGALEIVLGLVIILIPLLMKFDDADAESFKFISIYFAFYTGLYIQVRGFESIYRKWTSKSEKVNKEKDFGFITKYMCKKADDISID